VRRKFYDLVEEISVRACSVFVILFALGLMAIIYTVQIVFEKPVDRIMRKFFEPPKGENIISNYENFARRHPFLAWLLKWPLMLLGM